MKKDTVISYIFRIVSYFIFAIVMLIFILTIGSGIGYFSWDFFTQAPSNGMTAGGILPAILGSLAVLVLSLVFAIPVGMFTGIYLAEYGGRTVIAQLLMTAITSLAGVPSVVFGLFGLSLFCITFGFRTSLLAGSLTLSIMTLPVIASTVNEALKAIPRTVRESAYALGAKKTEVIFKVLIPYAKSRILTAILIGGGRVIGETAPILLTGAIFFSTTLPTSVMDPVMTLPSHIYYISMAYGENAQWMAKGASAFLMIFVLVIYAIAFRIRRKMNER